MADFIKSDDSKLFPILEWPGMMPQVMPLRKGMCYANDVNGKFVEDKTGAKVTKDKITVMVQVKTSSRVKTIRTMLTVGILIPS